MRYVCPMAVAVLSVIMPGALQAQSPPTGLSVTNYQFVSEQRLTRTESHVTYRAHVVNTSGQSWNALTATVSSLVPHIAVVPGQTNLHFGPVPAHGQALSLNTFTILVDRSVDFSFGGLAWSFVSPVANAGPNQTVTVGSTVTLNGSGSSNPGGIGALTYNWVFLSRPAGSAALLQNATGIMPSFVAGVAGNYILRLTVSNGVGSDSDEVTVSTTNSAPVANAGPNQTVPLKSPVVLNAAASSDVDGDPLTYSWTLISRPAGSIAALISPTSVAPSFFADKADTYVVQLVVHDGKVSSAPDTVTITTQNSPPVPNPGGNQSGLSIGALVQLNGSGSTDVDGDTLTYQWSLITRPPNSTAALNNPASVNPTFTADRPGTYVAQLIVNDGKIASAPATATITTNTMQAPSANAGANQTVVHGAMVTLHGSGTDPQALPLSFLWSIISKPAGSTAALINNAIPEPVFFADRPGTYVAQLIVRNGFLDSPPATVTITTTNTAPAANAGPNQVVQVGTTVILDGGGSSDSDNDPLTYSWSFTTKPAGSTAALGGADPKKPMFIADLAGTYVVQLIVNDGFANSTPSTVTVSAHMMTITLTPDPLNLYNQPGTLMVTLGAAAPASGLTVNLVSLNTAVGTVPSTVKIPGNATGANVTVTPGGSGSASILASAPGYQPGTATVNVSVPSIALSLSSTAVGLTRIVTGTITLNAPAPAGGINVALSAIPGGLVAVLTNPVAVPGGSQSGTFTVTGVAEGTATITASSAGYTSGTATVDVRILGAIFLASGVTVAPGQSTPIGVTLATPAPVGGVTIALVSGNPSRVTVTSSVFIAEGKTAPATPPLVNGINFGSAAITASAAGFTGDSETVQVAAGLDLSPPTVTIGAGGSQNLTVSLSAPAPAGGVVVNLSSSNPGAATVPPTVTIAGSATSAPVPVTAIAAGSSVITASTAAPNVTGDTANVTVAVFGSINLPAGVSVGLGQSVAFPVSLNQPAPVGGVTIALASGDPAKVTITPASISIAAGSTAPATQPQVTGVGLGSAAITASAPGFPNVSQTVQVGAALSFSPPSLALTGPGTQNLVLTLSAPAPAGGMIVNLSFNPAGIATAPATVTIPANTITVNVPVTSAAAGSTTITAATIAPGVTAATATITVQSSGIIGLPSNLTVSPGQSKPFPVTLPGPAPAGGLTVTLASSDTSKVTVSPATVTIAAGATTPATQPQVTGVSFGTANITASAALYTPGVQPVHVTATLSFSPQNPTITGPVTQNLTLTLSVPAPLGGLTVNLSAAPAGVIGVPASVTIAPNATSVNVPVTGVAVGSATLTAASAIAGVANATANVTVQSAGAIVLPASVTLQLGQSLPFTMTLPAPAPPGGLTVALASSDPSKVNVSPATVVVPAGATTPAVQPQVIGNNLGIANITATAPAHTSATRSVQVTASISLSPGTLNILGTETKNLTLTLSGPAPAGGLIFNLSSNNTAAATVSPATVNIPQNATTATVPVTGVAPGSATIRATAPFFTDATAEVTVSVPVDILLPANVIVGVGQSVLFPVNLAKAAASPLFITLVSSDTTKATLNVSSVFINTGQTAPSATPRLNGISDGSVVITATGPPSAGFAPATSNVTVGSALKFEPATLEMPSGGALRFLTLVLSGPAPPSGLQVSLSSNNLAVATVPQFATIGANTTTASVPVTGVGAGLAVITATATGISSATAAVTVVAPGTIGLPSNVTVPMGQSLPFPVTLSTPAPLGGVTVTLASSAPTRATISPATVNIPQGATTPLVQPQVQGIITGSANISASATGYTAATKTVQISATVTWLEQNVTIPVGSAFNLHLRLSAGAPVADGPTVALSSTNTSVVTVQQSVNVFGDGSSPTTVVVTIQAAGPGTATIKASGVNIPEATINITVVGPVTITTASLPNGQVGTAYSQAVAAAGGTPGYTWALIAGTLPAGLAFNTSTGTIGGTPTAAVAGASLTFRATDSGSPAQTATRALTLAIAASPVVITTASLANGQVGVAYSQTLAATGGTPGYTWALISGTLPAGIALNSATGVLSGTPTAAVSNASLTFRATDSATPALTATKVLTVTITPAGLAITTASLPNGQVGVAYSQTLAATGGTPGYTWALISGTLPAGVALNAATGVISGTPTAAVSNASLTFRATDSATPALTATKVLTLTIAPATLAITTASFPNGQVGVAYSQTLAATGGTPNYAWALTAGTLPAGLTLNPATGQIGGTPTTAVTNASLTFRATDSGSPAQNATKVLSLTIAPAALVITTASLPDGQVGAAYSQTLAATGGTPGYTWALTAGTLPAGLTLNTGTGQISGTPTAAVANASLTFRATDAGSPAQTATKVLTLSITPPGLAITTTALSNGQVGTAYSQTLAAAGGTPGYTWALTTGTLPAGLSLNPATGQISGSPTAAVTNSSLTFRVTDSGTPAQTANRTLTLTITPPPLSITTTALANGQVGTAYSQTLAATGGTPGYTWALTAGTLPAGLALNSAMGQISGTPTAAVTNASLTLRATDSGTPALNVTKILTLTIAPPPLSITTTALPNGQVGLAYSQTLAAIGGTPGYTWALTAGTLPSGLALNSSTGQISGIPTAAVTNASLTLRATDSGTPPQAITKVLTLTIAPPPLSITTASLPNGQVGVAYSQTLAATGGTPGYTWTLTAGTLPGGLTLNTATGQISGSPTAAVTNASLTFRATDSGTPAQTATKVLTLTIAPPALAITTTSLPNGQVGTAYSQTLSATGGTPGFTWALTAGTLPAGLALNAGTGQISGTPTAAVTNTSLTFRATDSGTPALTAMKVLTLTIAPPPLSITTASLPNGQVGVAYSQTLAAAGGTPAYTWALTAGTLPAGLALNPATGQINGTPTAAVTNAALTFRATDSSTPALTDTQSLTLTIAPATLSITTASLPNGQVGAAYSQTLAATGGTPGFTWALISGTLPAGLALNAATGQISGTPTAAVTSAALTLRVTDSGTPAQIDTQNLTLTIAPRPLSITTTSLNNGQVGVSYNQSLAATGGTPGYTFGLISGTLPAGLALSPAGVISGTPTGAGSVTLTFRATDSGSPALTANRTLTLTIAPPPVTITTTSLPDGTVNAPYSATLQAAGGATPYAWTLISGTLPAGLSLNSASGLISGMPAAAAANVSLTFRVSDSSNPVQIATKNLTFSINLVAGGTITLTNAIVGNGLQTPVIVTLSQPAPFMPGGFPVTISSSNPALMKVGARPEDAGVSPLIVPLGEGVQQFQVYVHGLANAGSANLTASAPGFVSGSSSITLAFAGFVLEGPNGIGASFVRNQGQTASLILRSYRLDSSLNLAQPQQVGGGTSRAVTIANSNPGAGTVSHAQVTFNGGEDSAPTPPAQFTGVAVGSTTITAQAPGGFSTPAGGANMVTATVQPAGMSATNVSVGRGLQTTARVNIIGFAPSGLVVTIASNDFTKLRLSKTPDGAGLGSITITVPPGGINNPAFNFFVQGFAATGAVTYTASAPGFGNATGTVSLTPSGFVIRGPNGIGANFSTTAAFGNSNIEIHPARLNAPNTYAEIQAVAGGTSVPVTVTSSNSGTGTITTSPVTIANGFDFGLTEFHPVGSGNTVLSVAAPVGFVVPSTNASVTATVGTSNLVLQDGLIVGNHLQQASSVLLGGPAPAGGVNVTLTSNSPMLQLGATATGAGAASITITVPTGQSNIFFYVRALDDAGTATYTATAAGYGPDTTSVKLAPSGVVILGNLGNSHITSLSGGDFEPMLVQTARLDPSTNGYVESQELAGGSSLSISLTNDNPAVGNVPTPVTINGGSASAPAPFTALVANQTTTIRVARPLGYTLPSTNTAVVVSVFP